MNLTDLAREHGDKLAVIMGGSGATMSFAELERRSNQVAHLFRARGLRAGDRIAVLMENELDLFPVVWAAQRTGLYYAPVNWHLSAAEAAHIVADCGARLLVSSAALEPLAAFMTNPAGSAIVNAIGPIRQIVQSHQEAERRYLVIVTGAPDKLGAPVQVQQE